MVSLYLLEVWQSSDEIMQPLSEEQLNVIEENWQSLTLVPDIHGFLCKLVSIECITSCQWRHINDCAIRQLLDFITRKDIGTFNRFVSCLRDENPRAAKLLLNCTGDWTRHSLLIY